MTFKKPANASAEVNAIGKNRARRRDGTLIKTVAERIRVVTETGRVVNKPLRLYTRGTRIK